MTLCLGKGAEFLSKTQFLWEKTISLPGIAQLAEDTREEVGLWFNPLLPLAVAWAGVSLCRSLGPMFPEWTYSYLKKDS